MLILDGENPVSELAFTPDATRLVIARASGPKPVPSEVRTIATGESVQLPASKDSWPAVAVHPSGRLAFLAYGGRLVVVNLVDGTTRDTVTENAGDVIVSPDGGRVIVTHFYGGHLSAFRCDPDATPACREEWSVSPAGRDERAAGFLDGGTKLVTAGERKITIRDTATGAVLREVRYTATSALQPTVSPDGTRMAVRSSSQFYLYDVATWKVKQQLATETRPYVRFVYHPTRPLLAAIMRGQTLVKFLDADTMKVAHKFNWRLGVMRAVCFSADGTLCAAGSQSGKVVVWDVDE